MALARELRVSDVLVGKVRRKLIWVEQPEGPNRNDIPRGAPIATLLLFGLRVEALCDLNGADVDFGRGVVRASDKTDAGHRAIPMVLNHRCAPEEPVFRTRTGRRQTPDNVRSRILAAENLPPITTCTPHTLRRTYASLCAEVGLAPRRCMRLMWAHQPEPHDERLPALLDMTAGAEEMFEKITGAGFAEAFAALSERHLPTILRPLTAEPPSQRSGETGT